MDRQAQEYSYSQPPQYSYAPQPQQFPQNFPPPAQHPSFNPPAQHPSYNPPAQHPSFNPPAQQPSFAPQFPPYSNSVQFYPQYATSAPPVAPPFDTDLQKRIDKLVEYILKNGPEFESMIVEKQAGNPDYSFLFGGEGFNYYRYKLSNPNPNLGLSNPNSLLSNPNLGVSNPNLGFSNPNLVPYQSVGPYQPYRLPAEVAAELDLALTSLTGTKESIKSAKSWFMQRAAFAPALAEALRDRVLAMEDSERQLHVIFLANDILFESLQHRGNPRELDAVSRALLAVLGPVLGRVYANRSNQHENQSRLRKIVQFWAMKEVFDEGVIAGLEREMVATSAGFIQPSQIWPHDTNSQTNIGTIQPPPYQLSTHPPFPVPVPFPTLPHPSVPNPNPNPNPNSNPYPLFPPGLVPGMVRKTQIGSGVPYSPLSPLDIPTTVPVSQIPDSQIRDLVSRFFKEIGEPNPVPVRKDSEEEEFEYERESVPVPPRGGMGEVDRETGMCVDGSVPVRNGTGTGTGRLGLGAGNESESESQYGDVYDSYRKQRSVGYHSFMSSRAENR